MAGPAAGKRTVIGTGVESVYGTPVVPDRRHPFATEGFRAAHSYVGSDMMNGEPTFLEDGAAREENTRGGVGQLVMDVPKTGLGRFLELMIGGTPSIVQQAATTAYLQTHTLGSPSGKSLTVQKALRAADGTVISSHRYHGCKVIGWQLQLSSQQRPRLTIDFDAEDEELAFETATLLGLSAPSPEYFTYKHGSLLLDSTPVALVTALSIQCSWNLDTNTHFIGGGGTKQEPDLDDTLPEITGSATYRVLDLSLYTDAVNNNAVNLKLALTADEIEPTYDELLSFDLPDVRFEVEATPQVGGPGVVNVDAPWKAYSSAGNPDLTVLYQSTDTAI